jgi:translation initiation factor IF-1
MMRPFYFWKNNQLIEIPIPEDWEKLIEAGLVDVLCADSEGPLTHKFGKFSKDKMWVRVSRDKVPAEFRVQLLLLGVPT